VYFVCVLTLKNVSVIFRYRWSWSSKTSFIIVHRSNVA
jgi:hypothetical protein